MPKRVWIAVILPLTTPNNEIIKTMKCAYFHSAQTSRGIYKKKIELNFHFIKIDLNRTTKWLNSWFCLAHPDTSRCYFSSYVLLLVSVVPWNIGGIQHRARLMGKHNSTLFRFHLFFMFPDCSRAFQISTRAEKIFTWNPIRYFVACSRHFFFLFLDGTFVRVFHQNVNVTIRIDSADNGWKTINSVS